ncbi:N-acetyltransferase [Peptostreptococcaceae bacterium OttesenSCG-928-C18]|nr:N-acetyltransferase [Peptostreptococcaceae bacterium OttesenSCG-928-C18]
MIDYKVEDKKVVAYDEDTEVGEITFKKPSYKFIIMDKTFVNENYRGKGIAQEMLARGVEYAKEKELKIIPLCPFVRKEFDENPEYLKIEYK